MGLELTRIGMQIRSIAALKLHNPGEGRVPTEFERHDTEEVDFDELAAQARESDIDFDELRSNVIITLRHAGGPVPQRRCSTHIPPPRGWPASSG